MNEVFFSFGWQTCLKIRIEGKMVVVPVPGGGEGLTISWLAKEAASRYKRYLRFLILPCEFLAGVSLFHAMLYGLS